MQKELKKTIKEGKKKYERKGELVSFKQVSPYAGKLPALCQCRKKNMALELNDLCPVAVNKVFEV